MRILILALALCTPVWLFSQHNHFLYIQSDNQQLFYVKRSGEVLSSSSTGFIILSKLQPGMHQFTIGFPRDQFPEYEFQVELRGRDRGFTLRNLQEKGWVLTDMQSQETITGRRIGKVTQDSEPVSYGNMSDDLFAVTLASVVNDPGIREITLVQSASMVTAPSAKQAEMPMAVQATKPAGNAGVTPRVTASAVKPASTAKAPAAQPVAANTGSKTPANAGSPNTESGKVTPAYSPKPIEKISELKTWTGYLITYIDRSSTLPDTIQVIIDDAGSTPGNGVLIPGRDPGRNMRLPVWGIINRSRIQIQQRWPDIFLS